MSFVPGLEPMFGGNQSALNVNAASAIVAQQTRLRRIIVVATTTGPATFNDAATTGAAAASNAILTIPIGATVGTVYNLDWPCFNGITLSAAGGGTFAVSFG